VARAAVPAINRAMLAGRTFGLRRLMATYATSRAAVVGTLRTTKATRSSLAAELSSRGTRLPLTAFRVNPLRPTVRGSRFGVVVRKGDAMEVKRGFVNVTKSGRLAVLQRESAKRFPVRMAFGPAVPQMFNEEGVREEIEARGMEVLERRFDHEVGRLLRGLGR